MPTLADYGIDKLSLDERTVLLHELEESVAADAGRFRLTDAQKAELDRRCAEDDADPDAAITWEEVDARLLARLRGVRP